MKITKREDGKFEIVLDREQLQELFEQVDKDTEYFDPSENHFSRTMLDFGTEAYAALRN